MNVRDTIERLLEATAQASALKAKVDVWRTELHDEALREYARTGAAPTWAVRGLGKVRLDGADAPRRPHVADHDAYASWVAQRRPDVVTATIVLDSPDTVEAALEALTFAGIGTGAVTLDVQPIWTAELLDGATVTVDHDTNPDGDLVEDVAVSNDAGEVLPFLGANKPAAPRIAVTLDPARKRTAIAEAEAELEDLDTVDAPAVTGEEVEPVRTDALGAPVGGPPPGAWQPAPEGFLSGSPVPLAHATVHADGTVTERPADPPVDNTGSAGVELPVVHSEGTTLASMDDLGSAARAGHRRGTLLEGHRDPYVGASADGARRSAQIDREEADGLDRTDHRREALIVSALRWEQQADDLEAEPVLSGPAERAIIDEHAPGLVEDLQAAVEPLIVRDVVDVDAPVLTEGPEPVEDTTPVVEPPGRVLMTEPYDGHGPEETCPGCPHEQQPGSPAAVDAARRTLTALAGSDAAWASSKADELHRLGQLADLGLGKGKVAKALLRERVTAALGALS